MNDAKYQERVLMLSQSILSVLSSLAPRASFKLEEYGAVHQLCKAAEEMIQVTEDRQLNALESTEDDANA